MSERQGPDVDKERRDLYAVSLVLLLLLAAGGSPSDRATLGIGLFELSRPHVIVWALWIAWAYFMWRYCLTIEGAWEQFRRDVHREVLRTPVYRRFCRAKIAEVFEQLPSWISARRHGGGPEALKSHQAQGMENAMKALRPPHALVFQPGKQFWLGEPVRPMLVEYARRGGLQPHPASPVVGSCLELLGNAAPSWPVRVFSVVPATLVAATIHHSFGDRIAPFLIGLSVPIIYVSAFVISAVGHWFA